jgi:hypothetical protein
VFKRNDCRPVLALAVNVMTLGGMKNVAGSVTLAMKVNICGQGSGTSKKSLGRATSAMKANWLAQLSVTQVSAPEQENVFAEPVGVQ